MNFEPESPLVSRTLNNKGEFWLEILVIIIDAISFPWAVGGITELLNHLMTVNGRRIRELRWVGTPDDPNEERNHQYAPAKAHWGITVYTRFLVFSD